MKGDWVAKYLQYRLPDGGGGGRMSRSSHRSLRGSIVGGIASLIGGLFLVLGAIVQTLAEIGIGILSIVVIVAVVHFLLSPRFDRR